MTDVPPPPASPVALQPTRCPETQNGIQCILPVGHTDPHRVAWPTSPTAAPRGVHKSGAIIAGLGGLAIAIGSLLPWAQVSTGLGTISVAGTQGDGVITLAIGAAIVVIVLLNLERPPRSDLFRVALFLLGGGAALLGINVIQNLVGDAATPRAVLSTLGVGLYLVVGGGIIAIIGALRFGQREAP